jgi:hypothetical protein
VPSATFYGPSPYLQTSDSPFYSLPGFQVETFEDGTLNLPGVTASVGTVVPPYPGNWYWTDSVDADDGVIDGLGYFGWSWWSTYGSGGTMTWTFDASQMGGHLPTHVGFVWTDGVIGLSDVTMEAFDGNGTSLGSMTGYNLADDSYYGTTDEDRFFGVAHRDGISRIVITTGSEFEVDHVQYAYDVDTTAPVVQSRATGTLGNNGWHVSDVQVAWTVTDPESAISETTGCEASSVTSDTTGMTFTCSATSLGGTTTESVTIKRDTTPPIATATAGPPPNANGWNRTNVTVTFTGTDATSGVESCDPPVILKTNGMDQSASGRCYDFAGIQSDLATASGINIDKTKPTVVITSPTSGAVYSVGQVVLASYACDDTLSGIASCVGTVANGQPIDTSKVSPVRSFKVTGKDAAGNSTSVTVKYAVQ